MDLMLSSINATTQCANDLLAGPTIKNAHRSRNPACNVPRRQESVSTDMVYSDTPAIDNGCKLAQVCVGRHSYVADACAMESPGEFVHTLTDCIRRRGAMQVLSSDNGKHEVSNRVKEVLRALVIDDWQNEAYNPNQQFFERWWGVIKGLVKAILDWSGAHASEWFLILLCVIYIRNRTAASSLGNITPLDKSTGHTPDISIMLQMPNSQPQVA